MYSKELALKDGRRVWIVEGNMPDPIVRKFWLTTDEKAREKYRHVPDDANEHQVFALDENDFIVAYGHLAKTAGSDTTNGLLIHPDWRGQGLSTHMMEALTTIAKRLGKSTISGEVDADNAPSLAMLKRAGYELYGPIYQIKKIL